MLSSVPFALIFTGLFALVLLVVAVMTFVLFYHWIRYNPGVGSTLLVMIVYSLGSAALLLATLGVLAQLS